MALSTSVVKVNGRPTEVRSVGQGEPLLYQHGGGIMEGLDFIEAASAEFQVHAPLLPGFGTSEPEPPVSGADGIAEHLNGVLDALGLEQVVLVGHSLGAWVAASFAARFPARVSRLILGSPLGMNVPGHPIADMLSLSMQERLALLSGDPKVWEGRLPTGPDPAFAAARQREQESLKHFAPLPFDAGLEETTSKLTMPTQLLWGGADRLIPVAHAKRWQEAIPQASLEIIEGAGHLIFAERPDALAAAVARPAGSGR